MMWRVIFPVVFVLVSMLAGAQPIPEYDRDEWNVWIDADGDCQNTRAEVLIRDSLVPVTLRGNCSVVAGLWLDTFSGLYFTQASDMDIDHMVPLNNAHRSGGWEWTPERKEAYANNLDPRFLIAVWDRLNSQKGDRGPQDWQPPNRNKWCQYGADWAYIKNVSGLSMTSAEYEWVQIMEKTCPT